MKKLTIFSLLVIGALLLTACGAGADTGAGDDVLKVVYAINGNLGDGSFIDSANRGLTQAMEELGIEYITNEAGPDPAGWEHRFLQSGCGGDRIRLDSALGRGKSGGSAMSRFSVLRC